RCLISRSAVADALGRNPLDGARLLRAVGEPLDDAPGCGVRRLRVGRIAPSVDARARRWCGMLAQTTTTTNAFAGLLLFFVILEIIFVIAFVIGWVKILNKAGYSGAWVVLGFVPFVNIVMFFVFAFSRWPVLGRPNGFYTAPPPFTSGGYQ